MVGDLHLALVGSEQSLGNLADGVAVGQLAVEEVTGHGPLHDVRPGEAGHLTEAIVAIDDRTVLHPGVGYHEFAVWKRKEK